MELFASSVILGRLPPAFRKRRKHHLRRKTAVLPCELAKCSAFSDLSVGHAMFFLRRRMFPPLTNCESSLPPAFRKRCTHHLHRKTQVLPCELAKCCAFSDLSVGPAFVSHEDGCFAPSANCESSLPPGPEPGAHVRFIDLQGGSVWNREFQL